MCCWRCIHASCYILCRQRPGRSCSVPSLSRPYVIPVLVGDVCEFVLFSDCAGDRRAESNCAAVVVPGHAVFRILAENADTIKYHLFFHLTIQLFISSLARVALFGARTDCLSWQIVDVLRLLQDHPFYRLQYLEACSRDGLRKTSAHHTELAKLYITVRSRCS